MMGLRMLFLLRVNQKIWRRLMQKKTRVCSGDVFVFRVRFHLLRISCNSSLDVGQPVPDEVPHAATAECA